MDNRRNGNFTSSEIARLIKNGKKAGSFGEPYYTYIAECNMERRLGRAINNESDARPLVWGKSIEGRVFNLLGIEYKLCSNTTLSHPEINCWLGTPDALKFDEGKTVCDIKSPMTMKSFCQLVDPLYDGLKGINAMRAVLEEHKEGEKYYWQLVSNAILTGSKYAELIVYCPYLDELEDIRNKEGSNTFISQQMDNELPYLIRGGHYQNINVIRFEVPEEDKIILHERVMEAKKGLIEFKTVSI